MAAKKTPAKKTVNRAKTSNGVKRTEYALPDRKMFPLNTEGRVEAAPGLAARAEEAGTITAAEKRKVIAAAARKRKASK